MKLGVEKLPVYIKPLTRGASRRIVNIFEWAKGKDIFTDDKSDVKSITSGIVKNILYPRLTVSSNAFIKSVLRPRSQPQIIQPVIAATPVLVVNFVSRPLAMYIEPRNPVRSEMGAVKAYNLITSWVYSAAPRAFRCARSASIPEEFSCFWVVSNEIFKSVVGQPTLLQFRKNWHRLLLKRV